MLHQPQQTSDALTAAMPAPPDAAYVAQLLGAADNDSVESTTASSADAATAQNDEQTIALPEHCLLRDTLDGQQQLLACLGKPAVCIDVAAVERIDTAYFQVLLAFVRTRVPGSVRWVNLTTTFVEAAQLLDLSAALSLPEASA